MKKQTASFIIGIGVAAILSGIYAAVSSGEMMDGLSGVFIGVALIGALIFDRNKKDQSE